MEEGGRRRYYFGGAASSLAWDSWRFRFIYSGSTFKLILSSIVKSSNITLKKTINSLKACSPLKKYQSNFELKDDCCCCENYEGWMH